MPTTTVTVAYRLHPMGKPRSETFPNRTDALAFIVQAAKDHNGVWLDRITTVHSKTAGE